MATSDLGRYSEPALLILVSLVPEPKHGYAIQEDVARLTGRQLGPGTLYGAIARLEERGLVERLDQDARRKPYRITDAGSEHLRAALGVLNTVASEGQRRLRTAAATQ